MNRNGVPVVGFGDADISVGNPVIKYPFIGLLIGTAGGAAIGSRAKNKGTGAAIGAIAGSVGGLVTGIAIGEHVAHVNAKAASKTGVGDPPASATASPWALTVATSVLGAASGWVIEEVARKVRGKRR